MSSGIGPPIASIAAREDEISERSRPMLPASDDGRGKPDEQSRQAQKQHPCGHCHTSIFTRLRIQMMPMR